MMPITLDDVDWAAAAAGLAACGPARRRPPPYPRHYTAAVARPAGAWFALRRVRVEVLEAPQGVVVDVREAIGPGEFRLDGGELVIEPRDPGRDARRVVIVRPALAAAGIVVEAGPVYMYSDLRLVGTDVFLEEL